MKTIISTIIFILLTVPMFGQRIVFPGQNQLYRFLEDPSYISHNKTYNMTGVLQASDSKMAQTSQYLVAQLSFFDNVAFGLDYSKHSFDSYRYSHILFSGRARVGFGNDHHYFNLGLSVGPDKSHQFGSAEENSMSTTYRFAGHYTNHNVIIGGFMNRYPIQYEGFTNNNIQPQTTTDGYSIYASYNVALSNNFRLTPMVRYNSYDSLSFFEGIAMLNYKGNFEMAASYKNSYSINAALSAKVFKRMKVSYSYEKSIGTQIFKDVHTLGISVDLGSKATDDPEWLANVKRNNSQMQRLKKNNKKMVSEASENEVDNIMEETVMVTTEDITEMPKPLSASDPEDTIDNRLKPGHYIVLGSFKILNNATKEVERLNRKGYYARIGKNGSSDDFNYVYVDRYTDKNVALDRIKDIKKEKDLEKTWVLTVE